VEEEVIRVQRSREKGWRMPEGAVYIGRPSPYGNPWPWDADWSVWLAIALGQRGDEAGRRAAAVIAYRWWLDGGPENKVPFPVAGLVPDGGDVEYSDGTVRHISDIATGLGVFMLGHSGLVVPEKRPDLEPLRGKTLVCWCPVDGPCHGDVIIEMLEGVK
jgi:Domain of unknown function (DUF4326)